jgi:hypothetical protein
MYLFFDILLFINIKNHLNFEDRVFLLLRRTFPQNYIPI